LCKTQIICGLWHGRLWKDSVLLKICPGQSRQVSLSAEVKIEKCEVLTSDRYAAVFTIHAASAETIEDSFCKIGKLGGLEATKSAGMHFLSQLDELWLLIIDNADDPSLDLQSLFPPGDLNRDFAHILVTTRNPDFRQYGFLGSLHLEGLKEQEALQLLLVRADIPSPWDGQTRNTGSRIARALGCLALAIIHAGNCIFRRICDLEDYLSLHSASRSMIQHKRTSKGIQDEESDMVKVVYSTFDLSFNFLLKKQTLKSKDASDLLKIISFYAFERIPVEIFTRAVINRRKAIDQASDGSWASKVRRTIEKYLEPPKMLPSFLRDDYTQLDKYRVTWAISELQSLSLLSYDGRERCFSLHPLVHAWARDSLSTAERSVWASIALNTLMESISLSAGGSGEAEGEFHTEILPHLEACLQEHKIPLSHSITALSNFQIQISKVLQPTLLLIIRDQILHDAKCGFVFADRGKFKKATVHLEMVKNALVRIFGNEDVKTMTAMLGLAQVYWGLGRLEEAITLQRCVVETRSKVSGAEHENTLQAMDQLGRSYWLHGQYQEALTLQNLTTDRMERSIGKSHPHTLAALDNLGVTLGSWHRFEESREVHQRVLAARQKSLGETHLDTLSTMGNLAMALLDLGRLDEARVLMSKVCEERKKQLGKEHPWTLWALCYLAKIHIEMGSLDEAESILDKGIEAAIRSLGEDHLGVLVGRGELARIYARQGKLDDSEELTLSTLKLIESSRGIAHPDCVFGLWKLAQLYELKDNRDKAIQTCQLALERADMRITRNHPLGKKILAMLQTLQSTSSDRSDSTMTGIQTQEVRVKPEFGVRHQQTW